MVESTTDLGTVKKLLDQVLEEVRSLKSIIQSEDSVVGKKFLPQKILILMYPFCGMMN